MRRFESPEKATNAFLESCEEQDVVVDTRMSQLLAGDSYEEGTLGVSHAVKEIAQELTTSHWLHYISRPIALEKLPASVPIRALGAVANVTTEVTTACADPLPYTGRPYGTCIEAEHAWQQTFDAAEKGESPNLQIFTDNALPVLLRKGKGNPTGLLLTERSIGSPAVPYPAGSLVRVQSSQDGLLLAKPWILSVPEPGVLISDIAEVTGLEFARLSVGAVDPDERDAYFSAYYEMPTIDEMAEMATELVARHS
jgi:hypothetical protein